MVKYLTLYAIALQILKFILSRSIKQNIIIVPGTGFLSSFFDPSILIPSTYRCIPCKYPNSQKNSDGSQYDFLCSVYFNKIIGLFPYVRTFRQSNTKSPIIIFMNEIGFLNTNHQDKKALKNCGVTLINIGHIESHVRGFQIVRLIYFSDFLRTCKLYFKRCIFTDGFDIFFQGDPFTTEISEKNIYLTIENETNNFINKSYSLKFPDTYKIICSQNIINCGIFAGGTLIMSNFLSMYLQMFPGIIAIDSQKQNYRIPYSDQDALNYFVYIYAKNLPIRKNIILLSSTSCFASIIGEIRYGIPNVTWHFPSYSLLSNGKRVVPVLVHQYTYSRALTASLIKRCGLLEHQENVVDYYRYHKK